MQIRSDIQQKSLTFIRKALRSGDYPNADEKWCLTQKIENEIFKWCNKTFWYNYRYPRITKERHYQSKLKSIVFNLSNTKRNPELNINVVLGKITPLQLITMTPHEMFPKLRNDYFIKKAEELERQRIYREKKLQEINDGPGLFICRKCKSKNTDYHQLQTRSADEPLTNFHLCNSCGHRWKT